MHFPLPLRQRRTALALLASALVCGSAALAQTAAPTAPAASAPPIPYATVAEALSALQARDGDDTVVVHSEGWVIVNEPGAAAQWSFTPADHAAYPAVVRRIIQHGPNRSVTVETASLCEARAEACSTLLSEFAAMNARVTQAVRGRGQAPTPPPPPTPPQPPTPTP